MPFDREGTLRKAEKRLRHGDLDLAIAEYPAVIDDRPADWNTANPLRDLYVRAGQVDRAMLPELQGNAGEYREISKRLEQLNVQMGS